LDPQFKLPGFNLTAGEMLAHLPAGPAVQAFDL
jgi:hypothetical protein